MDLQRIDVSPRPLSGATLSDLHFLANFIVSTYLGPDVKTDIPRRTASQRVAEGLPPYSSTDLGVSFLSVSQLESLYYFILRRALPNLALSPPLFHMYLKGDLPLLNSGLPEDRLQFTSFFPLHLHEQTNFLRGLHIVKGIVLISEPDPLYMKQDEVEKFRLLSGLDCLKIDINESQRYQHRHWAAREEIEWNYLTLGAGPFAGNASHINGSSPSKVQDEFKRRRLQEHLEMPVVQHVPSLLHGSPRPVNLDGPSLMPLLSIPNGKECKSDASIVLTGVAGEVSAGPPIGRVDIGVSNTAYFFRVALPGVRKDNRHFRCEVENDGKVQIHGQTSTGARTIIKRSRVFQMKLQQLCPPGPFTVSFRLPGPVDPRLFKANFRSDGIFEGIIVKSEDMEQQM